MTYDRFRRRNRLTSDYDLLGDRGLIADLDRMERDYLDPVYPEHPFARRPEGSDPLSEIARETGVDKEAVRKVLLYLFKRQR